MRNRSGAAKRLKKKGALANPPPLQDFHLIPHHHHTHQPFSWLRVNISQQLCHKGVFGMKMLYHLNNQFVMKVYSYAMTNSGTLKAREDITTTGNNYRILSLYPFCHAFNIGVIIVAATARGVKAGKELPIDETVKKGICRVWLQCTFSQALREARSGAVS
jgi:hypothetical protein